MNRKEAIEFILANSNDEVMSELQHFKEVYEDNKDDLNADGEFRDMLSHFEDVLDMWGDFKHCTKSMAMNIKELTIGLGISKELTEWQLRHMTTNRGRKYDFIHKGKKYECDSICAMDYYEEEPLKED